MTPLPAWLTLPELARLTGRHRHAVRRLLESDGVPLVRSGRKIVVLTSALRRAMPDLVEAIEQRGLQDVTGKPPA